MGYNTGTQSSGHLIYFIYNALKESVFLHCHIGIFSKYDAHTLFDLTWYIGIRCANSQPNVPRVLPKYYGLYQHTSSGEADAQTYVVPHNRM